jgi:hypothetical protein
MKKSRKGVHTTQTAQSRSAAQLNEEEKNLTINTSNKSEKEKQIRLMINLSDSLNELYENLSKLSKIMEKKSKNVN